MVILVEEVHSKPAEEVHSKPAALKGAPTTKKRNKRRKAANGNMGTKDNTADDGPKLTPYQGKSRMFGYFHCDECNKEWASANTWANCFQKCKGCNGQIYPYKQYHLRKGKGPKREAPPHPQDLCQRCMQLGSFCGNYAPLPKLPEIKDWEREE